MKRIALWLLIWLASVAAVYAGPYSNQLRTDPPQSGRFIGEDGELINLADDARRSPMNIARGLYPGAVPIGSFGERTTTGVETNYPVWSDSDIVFTPQLGVQMSVQSTSANDSSAGSNIQSIDVHYLNRKFEEAVEIIELNGVTPVLTSATNIRWVQCIHADRVGTIAAAAGNITVTYGGNTYSAILTGQVECSSSFRMVPKGMRLYLDGAVGASISATADTTTLLRLVATETNDHQYLNNPAVFIPIASIGLQNGSVAFNFPPGLSFNAGTLVGCTHTTNKAGIISCSWFGHLEPVE